MLDALSENKTEYEESSTSICPLLSYLIPVVKWSSYLVLMVNKDRLPPSNEILSKGRVVKNQAFGIEWIR